VNNSKQKQQQTDQVKYQTKIYSKYKQKGTTSSPAACAQFKFNNNKYGSSKYQTLMCSNYKLKWILTHQL